MSNFIVSHQTDPYWNIAVEQYLVAHADVITLYLWSNRRTVVIGQNQNPYSEVNLDALLGDGGFLMRRRTGGGAVYHDDGNINFSFVVPKALYDQQRQFAVVQRAVESFGLHTELSGRNDIMVQTDNPPLRKFSGNPFSKGLNNDLHHGTILIDGDMEALQHYLRPKPAKLQKHGVSSVKSRVANLHDLNPDITVASIQPRLQKAFADEYGDEINVVSFDEIIALPEVKCLHDELASEEWLYSKWKNFTAQRTGHFDWGDVELSLVVEDDSIRDVQIASDALDLASLDEARHLLLGSKLNQPPCYTGSSPIVKDLIGVVF